MRAAGLAAAVVLATIGFAGLPGCSKSSDTTPVMDAAHAELARGRALYQANCIACHNSDPKRPGALGPELAGSSQALIEARILRQAYPDGYTPKRPTHIMPALPQLKDSIPALHAYLANP